MAREEIVEKLDRFLAGHPVFDEDCHIVYLLVEVRKLLEKDVHSNLLLLKFYCDWTVHTEKSRNLGSIKDIVDKIDNLFTKSSPYPIRDSEIFEFLKMTELRKELRELLFYYSLRTNICDDNEAWSSLIDCLSRVLSDQPILNPKVEIKSISLVPFGKGRNAINIEFTDGRTEAMVGGER